MCSSPKLFAAYHVFHRLLVPRHPPCALTTLTVAGTIESCDSLFPHWCIALHQWVCVFFLIINLNDEIWCLDSFSFLKMILWFCMKFSRYTFLALSASPYKKFFLYRITDNSLKKIRQPPIFPGRLQPSIVGRISLNLRVRDWNGCDPDAHRHRKYVIVLCMSSFSYCARNFQSCFLSRYFVSFRVQHARLIHPLSIRTR